MGHGIDYSLGQSNRNPETGISFGIVNQNRLSDWFHEEVEAEYDPACPACGNDLTQKQLDKIEAAGDKARCPHKTCRKNIRRDDCFPEEPSRNVLKTKEGIKGFVDSDNDVWITKSPYVTRGDFCSPCAPGAVSIGQDHQNTDEDAPLAYCLPYSFYSDEDKPKSGTIFRLNEDGTVGDAIPDDE